MVWSLRFIIIFNLFKIIWFRWFVILNWIGWVLNLVIIGVLNKFDWINGDY